MGNRMFRCGLHVLEMGDSVEGAGTASAAPKQVENPR